jgi:putative transposase
VSEAKAGIGRYLIQYNTARPHSSLADLTPEEAYFTPRPHQVAA